MPVFRVIAIAGAILLALLFVADATFSPRGPLFTNNTEGLPRSQPARPQVAEWPQEAARPRAPTLAEATPEPSTAPNPAATATPLAAVVETSGSTGTQLRTQSAKTEPTTTEPARAATAKLEAAGPEAAKSEPVKSEPVKSKSDAAAPEAIRPAPKPKMHKHAARKPERRGRYTAYRDDAPALENGYPYGEPYRKEQNEWQRQWSEKQWSEKPWHEKARRDKPWRDDFSENGFRF